MNKLGVLIIRGSGDTGFKRQEKFINKVNRRLTKKGIDISKIVYEYVDWYDPLQSQQDLLLDRMFHQPGLKLKSKILRKFLLGNISDLINYGGKPNLPTQSYEKTHGLLHVSVKNLQKQVSEDTPLVILASSMGTEIMNNYIWDRQYAGKNDPYGKTAFERFEASDQKALSSMSVRLNLLIDDFGDF